MNFVENIRKKMPQNLWELLPIDLEAKKEVSQDKQGGRQNDRSDRDHLLETINWLCRAQDSSPDGGVARGYHATRWRGYLPRGWQASYPETTGYIIPTMLAASDHLNQPNLRDRAFRMADWEIDIQLPSGAVMGSVVTARPLPAVFNTGQVIFGWLAVFKLTNTEKYIKAAAKAADYLMQVQESDGAWRSGNSQYALSSSTVYNTRAAWALIELGLHMDHAGYVTAGRNNIEFALKRQKENGWFSDNCLSDPARPLLHTIVYATRGILESGMRLNENRYVNAALRTLDALCNCQREDGGIPGRLDEHWNAMVSWDCVTGDAQAAIAWLRANALTGDPKYRLASRKAIDFVKKTQNLRHPNPGIRGGVKGSFPFDGEYGRFEMLNWAAKFFCDALLMITDENRPQTGICG
ncbi:MAG: hypothetical protein ACOZF0_00555 [Thermodesulfobacteriota bacterium]